METKLTWWLVTMMALFDFMMINSKQKLGLKISFFQRLKAFHFQTEDRNMHRRKTKMTKISASLCAVILLLQMIVLWSFSCNQAYLKLLKRRIKRDKH